MLYKMYYKLFKEFILYIYIYIKNYSAKNIIRLTVLINFFERIQSTFVTTKLSIDFYTVICRYF